MDLRVDDCAGAPCCVCANVVVIPNFGVIVNVVVDCGPVGSIDNHGFDVAVGSRARSHDGGPFLETISTLQEFLSTFYVAEVTEFLDEVCDGNYLLTCAPPLQSSQLQPIVITAQFAYTVLVRRAWWTHEARHTGTHGRGFGLQDLWQATTGGGQVCVFRPHLKLDC